MRNFGYFEEDYQGSQSEKGLWLRVIRYLRPYWIPFAGSLLLSLLITTATLGLPWLMQQAIDLYITPSSPSIELRSSGLSHIALLYGGLILGGFILSFFQVLLLEWIGQSIMDRLRQELFSHLLHLPVPFFREQATGRLVTRLTNDVQNMHEMFTSVMVTLFNDLLKMTLILCILLSMNLRLGLLLSLFVPLATVITVLFARLARTHFRAIRTQLSRLNSFVQERVEGIALIQLFGRGQDCKREFAQLNKEYLDKNLRQIHLFAAFMPLTEFMGTLAVALILYSGGAKVIDSRLSLGELVAFLSYMRLFFQPLRELSQKYSIVQSALASAERIFELLDTPPEKQAEPVPDAPLKDAREGELSFENICFSYHPDIKTLHDISFTIKKGETVALVGPTGGGKSTILNLILRFYEPDSGTITIGGSPLNHIPHKQQRRDIGVVMQEMLLLEGSLYHNISLDTGKSPLEVGQLLEEAQLNGWVARLPQGLDTLIGTQGHAMSLGEKQLLAIARVLCRNPSLVVLDEASSAIDSRTEELIETPLRRCFKGKTVLIIAHRLSTVQRADRILVLDQGKIIEQGSHLELLGKNGLYRRLVMLDFGLETHPMKGGEHFDLGD